MKSHHIRAAILGGIVLCFAVTAQAQNVPGDNPPTFQSIGMLDALARDLAEADCRVCHDTGVPDRHQLLYEQPIPPGTVVPYPDADNDGSPDTIYTCISCHGTMMTIVRDCLVCHDAGSPHHTTQDAFDLHCTACHGDLVDDYDDGHYVPSYSPSLVTPYRGLDGDGYENAPFPTSDLASDGSGMVLQSDVTFTEQGPPFFAVTNIGPLGTTHARSEPDDLSFKPPGFNNDFVIASTHFDNSIFQVVFYGAPSLAAAWDAGTQTLAVDLAPSQTALDLVNAINAAAGLVDVEAELGFDGENPVLDALASDHYEQSGGNPANHRGFGAGSCSYCHDIDGTLDANGQPDGLIWDNRTLHHDIGLPALVNDGAGGTMSWCEACHESVTVFEQSGPNFDFSIRHCERCHGTDSLHNIQVDSPNPSNIGTLVVGGEDVGYGHVGRDAGTADSDCWGCHGFEVGGARAAITRPIIPTLRGTDRAVIAAGRDTTVSLTGAAFTSEDSGVTYASQVRLTAVDGASVTLQPTIVDAGQMSVTIPGETPPGNYELRAVKDRFASNPLVISVKPEVVITDVTADRGRVTILGFGFGGYARRSVTSVMARSSNRRAQTLEGEIVSWNSTRIVAVFTARPNQVTVHSVYGSATSRVNGKGKPRLRF